LAGPGQNCTAALPLGQVMDTNVLLILVASSRVRAGPRATARTSATQWSEQCGPCRKGARGLSDRPRGLFAGKRA